MVAGNFSPTEDMVFGEANIAAIGLYFLMFSVGLTTNSLSLYKLIKARHKLRDRSRMTLLLIHLAVADMLVRRQLNLIIRSHETYRAATLELTYGMFKKGAKVNFLNRKFHFDFYTSFNEGYFPFFCGQPYILYVKRIFLFPFLYQLLI